MLVRSIGGMASTPAAQHEDPVLGAFEAIDAAVTTILSSDPRRRSTAEQIQVLRRTQTVLNRLPALHHREIAALRHQACPAELGDTLQRAVAEILRIARPAATRLVNDAEHLGPRTALSGEPLDPWLAETARAQAEGALTAGHVEVIREFFTTLPGHVNQAGREDAERTLVANARRKRPDELRKDGLDLFLQLDQDGTCPEPKPRNPETAKARSRSARKATTECRRSRAI